MNREFDWHAAGVAYTLPQPSGEDEMVTIAGRQIGAGLRNADNGPSRLQLGKRQPEVHVSLQVQRGHVRIGRVVKPGPGAQEAR
jgi:hypothetical protein